MQDPQVIAAPEATALMTKDSTSKEYPLPKTEKKPEHKKKKRENLIDKFLPLINTGVILVIITNCFLLIFLLIAATKKSLKPSVAWETSSPGRTFHLDDADFLISSTSESCNEFVRKYIISDKDNMDYSYIFMVLCLDVAEPHRSSQAGNSYLVKANAKSGTCHTVDGWGTVRDLDHFRPYIEIHKESEYLGTKSCHDPAAFRIVEDYVIRNGITGRLIVLNILKDLSTMSFPMTQQLYQILTSTNIENQLQFQPEGAFRYLFREFSDKSLVAEGELMGKRVPSHILDRHMRMVRDQINIFGNEAAAKETKTTFEYDFAFKTDPRISMKKHKMVAIPNTDYKICAIKEPVGLENRTIASLLVQYAKDPVKSANPPVDMDIYSKMYGLLMEHFPDTYKIKQHMKKKKNVIYEREVKMLGDMLKSRHVNDLNYGANSFVIVNNRDQVAVSYISSIGTAFGSLMSVFGPSDIGNNMMYEFANYYESVGEYRYFMDPMIITKGKQIHIAYAGQGGWFRISLDIVRRFYSLVFNLFHNIHLDEALTYPLFYPLSSKAKSVQIGGYSQGFPWVYMNEMHKTTNTKFVIQKKPDVVTAIYNNTALYFDGKDGTDIQPHGI